MVSDAWVKASGAGEMTGGFGILENSSEQEAIVTSLASSASPMMELHETVMNDSGQMVMREVQGGFAIPAKGHLHLEPGGDHLMLMGLTQAVRPGEEVTFALTFSDGSTLEFVAVVKDYAGANESYEDHSHMGHDDMDHGDPEHGGH